MKTIQVRLPDNLHCRVKRSSKETEISMNQFIVTSTSNEIVRQETSDFFREAASPVGFDLHVVAFDLEVITKTEREIAVVLDDQNPGHGCQLVRVGCMTVPSDDASIGSTEASSNRCAPGSSMTKRAPPRSPVST